MAQTLYITKSGQRWDNIAMMAYGFTETRDTFNPIRELQAANPFLPSTKVFKAGVKLIVPVYEVGDTTTEDVNIAPWKRGQKIENAPAVVREFDPGMESTTTSGFDSSFDSSFG